LWVRIIRTSFLTEVSSTTEGKFRFFGFNASSSDVTRNVHTFSGSSALVGTDAISSSIAEIEIGARISIVTRICCVSAVYATWIYGEVSSIALFSRLYDSVSTDAFSGNTRSARTVVI